MLRNVIGEVEQSSYSVCLGLFGCFPKFFESSAGYVGEELLARTAIKLDKKYKLSKKGRENSFLKEVVKLCELYLAELSRIPSLENNLAGSDFITSLSPKKRDTEKAKCGRLSRDLNLLVLKSRENAFQKFTGEYNAVELDQAIKFLEGVQKKSDEGSKEAKELEPLLHAAVENLRLCSLSRKEKFNNSDEKRGCYEDLASKSSCDASMSIENYAQGDDTHTNLGVIHDSNKITESTQDVASKEQHATIETQQQGNEFEKSQEFATSGSEPTIVSPNSEPVTAKREFRTEFPLGSLLAVLDPSGKKKDGERQFANDFQKIAYWENQLQRLGHKVERQCQVSGFSAAVKHRWLKNKKLFRDRLYVKAVEDLNLYCLANGIVNQSFNIEAPTLVDVTRFLESHDVGLKNEYTIRAILSTLGYPGSDTHALAAAFKNTTAEAGQPLDFNDHEVDLFNEISPFVIRNQVYSNIDLALVANKHRIDNFLDTNAVTIPYMAERNILNLLAFVGRYEDESIVKASRLPIPEWSPRPTSNNCHDRGKTKLYSKCVFNLFVAWQEINNRLSSERPEEQIFCAEFILKLVKQSAGKYSEALVNGIANFCALHEFDVDQDLMQPFLRDNNYLCKFLDSNWDSLLSKIDISRSLNVLVPAGMPGTNDDDIVQAINDRSIIQMKEYLPNYDILMLSRQLLIVAAATNQIDKLTVLKDPKGPEYVKTFDSLLREILSPEKLRDPALSKSERISKSISELKTHLFARWLQLPALSVVERFLKSNGNKIAGQPNPLSFLGLIGKNSDKTKRKVGFTKNSENYSPLERRFDYLLVTHKLVDSMIKAKLPVCMFDDNYFPDLRNRDPGKIVEYDEIIDENQVTKADKILCQIYRIVRNGGGTAPEHFVEAADAVNLFCLSRGASSINKQGWFQPKFSDATVKLFKKRNCLPEANTKDDELIKQFFVTHGMSKSGTNKDPGIIQAMKTRLECSAHKALLKRRLDERRLDDCNKSVSFMRGIKPTRCQEFIG